MSAALLERPLPLGVGQPPGDGTIEGEDPETPEDEEEEEGS